MRQKEKCREDKRSGGNTRAGGLKFRTAAVQERRRVGASHVKVTTVGGLVTGLWGARAAAESILKNTSYAKALRRLNRELWLHELIRRVLNRFRPAARPAQPR